MLRLRIATNLLFNLLLAAWVLHDARTRRARKPLFASFLTLLWGPLGLAFWISDRPLTATDERRGGTGWVMARTFIQAITALVPAGFLLVTNAIQDRMPVPGSLGASCGVMPASIVITAAGWIGLVGVAFVLGRVSHNRTIVERGTSAVKPALPGLGTALAIAGAASFALAFTAGRL